VASDWDTLPQMATAAVGSAERGMRL